MAERAWSFGARLALAFALVGAGAAALTALLVNLAFGQQFAEYLEGAQAQRQHQIVSALAGSYEQAGGWDPAALDRLAGAALMDGGTLEVVDADGAMVWAGEAGPMAEMHREMMGTGPLGPERDLPVEVGGQEVGTATMRLPEPGLLPQDVAFRRSVNRLLLYAGLAAAVAALAIGLLLARRATAPARQLTHAAAGLAAGDRSARIQPARTDEFGDMAAAFNRMADQIEAEDLLRRGFAADVAHELRTPLMILRGEIEALEDGVVEPSPQALASLREETLRLGRLVDDLDTLARADAAGFTLDRAPTGLDDVVAKAAEELTDRFREADVGLDLDVAEHLPVLADAARLRQVVTNLLVNALKFTPAGGRVRVSASRDGDSGVIEVADTGPGIPDEELPRVFDRFFRGSAVRAGGSGIGLTVVRQLVEAHDGTVAAGSVPGAGATFTVRLPLRRRAAPTSS
jgi:two-component system, OmpR family, sensor histidine kinase BaeS